MTITKDYEGLQLINDEHYKLDGDIVSDEYIIVNLDKPLHVCGNIKAEGYVTADHDIIADGNIIAEGYIYAEGNIIVKGNITAKGSITAM